MAIGVEGLVPVEGLSQAGSIEPTENLVDIKELGQEFEQNVFGDAQGSQSELGAATESQGPSVAEKIGNQVIQTMEGLNTELESTMQEVMRLISKKPDQAELLQLQLKATQLFITHELSSKVVSKATSSVDQLVHSQ